MSYVLFKDSEEAWYWFIESNRVKQSGARPDRSATFPRPIEISDMYNILERMRQQRLLTMDHLLVMRHYGLRGIKPDPNRLREELAHKLWVEAMDRLNDVLSTRGLIDTNPQ